MWGSGVMWAGGLDIVKNQLEFTDNRPDFLCYCGFLLFPMTALGLCIRLTFNYPEAD